MNGTRDAAPQKYERFESAGGSHPRLTAGRPSAPPAEQLYMKPFKALKPKSTADEPSPNRLASTMGAEVSSGGMSKMASAVRSLSREREAGTLAGVARMVAAPYAREKAMSQVSDDSSFAHASMQYPEMTLTASQPSVASKSVSGGVFYEPVAKEMESASAHHSKPKVNKVLSAARMAAPRSVGPRSVRTPAKHVVVARKKPQTKEKTWFDHRWAG